MDRFASICILSYNRQRFLRDCINSLLLNSGYPIEIIVHDDGSEDHALRSWQRQLVDVGAISTLIENPPGHNQGQGIALNRMFSMAKGDPIVKCDHDLIFSPGWLSACIDVLDRNRRLADGARIGALGLFHYHADHEVSSERTLVEDHGYFEEHRDFVGSAMVIPREAWTIFGPFTERSTAFAEDHDFKKKVAATPGWCVGLMPEDVARNQGFGLGPSTVVAQKEDGSLTSASINEGPFLLGRK